MSNSPYFPCIFPVFSLQQPETFDSNRFYRCKEFPIFKIKFFINTFLLAPLYCINFEKIAELIKVITKQFFSHSLWKIITNKISHVKKTAHFFTLRNLKYLLERFTHDSPIVGSLFNFLPMTNSSRVKNIPITHMTKQSCKANSIFPYMSIASCKANSTFIYISKLLIECSSGYESSQFIIHSS